MARLLLYVLLGFLAAAWLRRQAPPDRLQRPPGGRPGQAPPPELMVACARCGLNIPRSEGIPRGGKVYCCDEHARAGG